MYIKNEADKVLAQTQCNPFIKEGEDFRRHLSYGDFMKLEIRGVSDEQKLTAWTHLINGFILQDKLNIRRESLEIGDDEKFRRLLDSLYCREMNEIYKQNFEYFKNAQKFYQESKLEGISVASKEAKLKENYQSFIKNIIRSDNEHFIEFAKVLGTGLEAETMRDIALWSGGIDLSKLAYDCGKMPLEHTVLGRFLDTHLLISVWEKEAPLWNIISRKFIEVNNKPVHVYFRLIDDASVLMRQELPHFRQVHRGQKIIWHPIACDGAKKDCEVGLDGNLICIASRNQGFYNQINAIQALENKLRLITRVNAKAFQHANSEIFQPNHPPFGLGSDLPYAEVCEYIDMGKFE